MLSALIAHHAPGAALAAASPWSNIGLIATSEETRE
jgi:hypothetical protein